MDPLPNALFVLGQGLQPSGSALCTAMTVPSPNDWCNEIAENCGKGWINGDVKHPVTWSAWGALTSPPRAADVEAFVRSISLNHDWFKITGLSRDIDVPYFVLPAPGPRPAVFRAELNIPTSSFFHLPCFQAFLWVNTAANVLQPELISPMNSEWKTKACQLTFEPNDAIIFCNERKTHCGVAVLHGTPSQGRCVAKLYVTGQDHPRKGDPLLTYAIADYRGVKARFERTLATIDHELNEDAKSK